MKNVYTIDLISESRLYCKICHNELSSLMCNLAVYNSITITSMDFPNFIIVDACFCEKCDIHYLKSASYKSLSAKKQYAYIVNANTPTKKRNKIYKKINQKLNKKIDGNKQLTLHDLSVFKEKGSIAFSEGKLSYKIHKKRERSSEVTKKAKELFKEKHNGRVFCEACGFNFESFYGERGIDFIEGHHRVPISKMSENDKTKVEDIALLCSNCHRIIHKKPFISVDELSEIIRQQKLS